MQRLSGLDATFLYLETPTLHMHVAMTAVFDPSTMPGGYSFERVKEFIGNRVHLIPPFHQRLVEVPFRLNHPLWVKDPEFDLDYHVRRIGAPSPGGPAELGRVAGQIASTPLDRSRPLWEAWVVEGLEGGNVALVAKVHHCGVDGSAGAQFMVHLFDLEADAVGPDAPTPIDTEEVPSDRDLMLHAAASRMRQRFNILPLVGKTVSSAASLVASRNSKDRPSGALPLTAPATPFNASISSKRNVAFSRVALADIKAIKNAADATVNDVVLAICSGTLRRYLEAKDELPALPLLAVCPVAVGPDERSGPSANSVSAMFTSLASDISDPALRLAVISENTKGAKEDHHAIGADMLQGWTEFAAPNTFALAARLYSSMHLADRHRPIHNLVISNVPGPPFPLYFAGAELQAAYPMGPVMEGAGLNVTVMSYRDSVDFGFMVCDELVPDVWDLAACVEPAFAELFEAVVGR
ncbi:MAG: wax ester/triacylglycerol synthase family O-acyltransferase [Acidimicrobiales bacterium]|nr:wax ester/triacylglycerol synthase family O-acyltransferase [Acidimicrobiales bacterium]MCB1014082.1 wax ester/triacylglycerol synthase family O-acyltransferase [Acidimicrobiales bacterium]MCB9373186.1 wax ester/triacylglycerol synthase family O-acyltransferase [Microthrixaceae bacterium]